MLLLIKNRLKLFIEYLKVVSSKLSIFLHSEVNLLIQHIIVQDQGGQNNIHPFLKSFFCCYRPCEGHFSNGFNYIDSLQDVEETIKLRIFDVTKNLGFGWIV